MKLFPLFTALVLASNIAHAAPKKPAAKPVAKPTAKPQAAKPAAKSNVPTGPLMMVPPKPHDARRAAISPDGRWVATSGGEGVRIWESDTGRSTREISASGHLHWMNDSRRLLIGGTASRIVKDENGRADSDHYGVLQLWDAIGGKMLREWQFESEILDAMRYIAAVQSMDVSEDETRVLITTSGVGHASICNLADGTMPVKILDKDLTAITSGHFLKGDKEFALHFVSQSYEKKWRSTTRHDAATGKIVGKMAVNAPIEAASRDGKVFVNEAYRDLLNAPKFAAKADGGFIVDEASGKVLRTVEGGFAGFSPSGKKFVRVLKDRFALVDIATGKETLSKAAPARGIVVEGLHETAADAPPQIFAAAAVSPEEKSKTLQFVGFRRDEDALVSVSGDGRATLWNAASMTPQTTMQGWGYSPTSFVLSPNGISALVKTWFGGSRPYLQVLDVMSGRTLFWAEDVEMVNAQFTRDSQTAYILTTTADEKLHAVRRLNLAEGTLSEPMFRVDYFKKDTFQLSPDETILYYDQKFYDAPSGRELATIKEELRDSGAFNAQNQFVARYLAERKGGGVDFVFATFEPRTGKIIAQSPQFADYYIDGEMVRDSDFLRYVDGATAALFNAEYGGMFETKYIVVRRDVASAKVSQVWDYSVDTSSGTRMGSNNSLLLTPDGHRALSYDRASARWRVLDMKTGKRLRVLSNLDGIEPAFSGLLEPAFFGDEKFILSTQLDDTLRVRDANGKTLLTYLTLEGGDWLAYTPRGQFDGSQGAIEKVYFSSGSKTYNLDQFAERFYRPGLVQLVLNGKAGTDPLSPEAALAQGAPPMVQIVSPKSGQTGAQEIEVTVKATQQNGGGVRAIRLYHNGRLVGGLSNLRGIVVEGLGANAINATAMNAPVQNVSSGVQNEMTQKFTIALEPGENLLRAVAYSRTDLESTPAQVRLQCSAAASAKPVLRVLTVGINQYADVSMNLKYARRDAESLGEFFQTQKSLFSDVKITKLVDDKATGQGIESALKTLASQSKPGDVVVIYLAGHGETAAAKATDDDNENAPQSFYFLPAEMRLMRDKNNVRQYGLSGDKLDALVSQIAARRVLIVYDACKSGAALGGLTAGGAQEQRQLALWARAQGLYILTASTAQQYASEENALGHGILTYAMLEGLRGKASPSENQVKVGSLLSYTERRVPALAMELRNREQRPVRYGRGINFALAKK